MSSIRHFSIVKSDFRIKKKSDRSVVEDLRHSAIRVFSRTAPLNRQTSTSRWIDVEETILGREFDYRMKFGI